ncbi:MAG: HAD family hydrolase [Syntrophobacteraceae bacterium]|nr:HAD family hydrolase [Desulfobacteraceae bacterium]
MCRQIPRSELPGNILPRSLRLVAFDCDGVIFDSKDANVEFYTHILEQVGSGPVRPDQYEFIHMHPVSESLRYLLGEGAHLKSALEYSQTIDFRDFNAHLRREPGVLEILKLSKAAYKTALATNRTVSTRDVLVYHGLESYFDLIVSASDVSFPKPHPEIMLRILAAFGIPAEEVIYIGDSAVDEAMAEASGVFFVAYKNPELRADLHVEHFDQLYPLLLERAKGHNGNGG